MHEDPNQRQDALIGQVISALRKPWVDGKFLQVVGGKPAWDDPPAGGGTTLVWTPIRITGLAGVGSGPRDLAEWALLDDLLLLRGTMTVDSSYVYGQDIGWVDVDLTPFQSAGERVSSAVNVNFRTGATTFKPGLVSLGNRGGAALGGWNDRLEMVLDWNGGGPTGAGATFYLDGHIRLHGDS